MKASTIGARGKFLTTKDFEGRDNATLTDMLRSHVPGLLFVQQPGGGYAAAGKRAIQTTIGAPVRSVDMFGGVKPEDQCYMQLLVDGQRIYTYHRPQDYGPNPPKLEDFAVSNILGVEVYRGAAETPLQFNTPGAACGTIVIWTGGKD
jgi:TonB-dependent receptor-like protein